MEFASHSPIAFPLRGLHFCNPWSLRHTLLQPPHFAGYIFVTHGVCVTLSYSPPHFTGYIFVIHGACITPSNNRPTLRVTFCNPWSLRHTLLQPPHFAGYIFVTRDVVGVILSEAKQRLEADKRQGIYSVMSRRRFFAPFRMAFAG